MRGIDSKEKVNPYVFIVGCPRSGTTLLQRVVNAHPKIAVVPEAPWIYHLLKARVGITPRGTVTPDLAPALLEHPKFGLLGINRDQLLPLIGKGRQMTYSTFVRGIFDLYGVIRGKELVGNKTPALVRRLNVVHKLWPEARIIHLIRDGRDVYLSMKNRPLHSRDSKALAGWEEDPVSTAALWWELNVQLGRKASKSFGPELYCEVRYESLVNRSTEFCAELCAFLGVTYSDVMLRFYEREKTKRASRPITPGLRNWRSQMSSEDVELFEAAAGKTLEDLGYPRVFAHPRDELMERSARKRDSLLAQSPRYARAYAAYPAPGSLG